jgi:hypothetical protein
MLSVKQDSMLNPTFSTLLFSILFIKIPFLLKKFGLLIGCQYICEFFGE